MRTVPSQHCAFLAERGLISLRHNVERNSAALLVRGGYRADFEPHSIRRGQRVKDDTRIRERALRVI